jgi:hypothetical protein
MNINYEDRAMAQVVSRRPLSAEARVCAWSVHVECMVDKVAMGNTFLHVLRLSLSISFHRFSPLSHIVCRMDNRAAGGRSSETQSHPIDMNNNTLQMPPIPFWSWDVQIAIYRMRYSRSMRYTRNIYLTALYSISVVRNFAECPQSNYHPRCPAAGVVLVSWIPRVPSQSSTLILK